MNSIKRLLTRADAVIIVAVIAVSSAGYFLTGALAAGGEKYAVIEQDGRVFAKFKMADIKTAETVDVRGHNTVEITSRYARVIYADCPDKIDVKQGAISRPGQVIICMPNKMVVRITGETEMDAVSY